MPLKPAMTSSVDVQTFQGVATPTVKSYAENKDARILYQGLTQAALQSMPLGQFAPDLDTHLNNVKLTVDAMAAFVLDRSK